MADIYIATQGTADTPAPGNAVIYVDSTSKLLGVKDESGRVWAQSYNASIAAQTVNAADTYLTHSDIIIPSFSMQAKGTFVWMVSASKTAAGVAQPVYTIRIGSAKTTADAARLSLTAPAQTAVADMGTLCVMVTVRSVGSAGVLQGTAWWAHRGTAANTTTSGTGFANDTTGHVEGTSAGFDNAALGGNYIGLSVNSGAAGVWTVTQVVAEANW